jgi:DNA primase
MNSVTDTIKDRIDIVEFVQGYMSLRKSGKNFVGFCPFHTNTKTPAFYVFPDTQSFHCFGCKASGDVFDFLTQREGLEFRDALEQLAQRAGVELKPRTEEDQQHDQLRTRLLDINAAAAVFFHHVLVKSQRGEAARAYVAKRQLHQETLESFQLGYAVDDWSALLTYLTDRKGFEPEEIEAAGLAIRRDNGGYYDRFRNRLMFPIRNVKGDIIAFGGRAIGDAQPKYMNSPQTPLFDKGKVLYGLDLARETIRQQDAIVIVEGYVDVIIAHQYGFKNVVAPLGTALTADHVGVVKKLARRVYLALDADAAGINATIKGLKTIQDNMDGHAVPVPTPQGFVRWERELEAEIRIIELPEGRDPDEVIQENPEQWRTLLAGARPVMDFYMAALTADLDMHSGKGKAEAVKRLAPLLNQIANQVEQAHYVQQVARLVAVEEYVVRGALAQAQRQQPRATAKPTAPAQPLGAPGHEDYLLSWMLRYPSARKAVQEKIRRDLLPFPLVHEMIQGIPLELFQRAENRAIWQAWDKQPEDSDPMQWGLTLDESLREQAQRILTLNVAESQAYRYVNDALECATILQLHVAREWKNRLSQQFEAAESDEELLTATERLIQIKTYIDTLSTPKRSPTYADLHTLRAV